MEVRDEKKEGRTEPVDKLETFPLSEEESDKVFSMFGRKSERSFMALI